jgi:hypothetical protein
VRTIVPPLPLAHAIRSLTALMPRNRAETPLVCSVHVGAAMIDAASAMTVIRTMPSR